ncbi:MAG: DUF4062 domain-containing protein, partial [Calditrichaeota bacterium]|nr:DUF4062 domain-containing protein [Calditrichota bacterium]
MSLIWKTQPIFISSTFTDMMAERDALRDFVFPELEERLKERRLRLEPIDLRWGVETSSAEEQEQKELLVLKVCLDEIDRCKPFFIGIVGDRYGWVPPAGRMQAAEQEKGFQSALKDKSVTALEIEYGVLASKEQLKRSFFFFREPLPYEKMPAEKRPLYSDRYNPHLDAGEAENKLKSLKNEILKVLGKERIFSYRAEWDGNKVSGLEEFKQQILECLWQQIDEETRQREETRPQSWQEEERVYLEDFIEDRTVSFSGREDLINELKTFVLGVAGYEHSGICLTGESGSGKSALFAKLYQELRQEEVLILAHAAGISLRSNSLTNMLTLWIEELAGYLQRDVSTELVEKNSFDDLRKLFTELLSQTAAQKRVLVLVDALNQFERSVQARYVNWLPELLPENAKFIFTAIAGEETDHLSQRKGIQVREIKALNRDDAGKIIDLICKRYHKTLNPEVLHLLLDKQRADGLYAFSNALWLTMVVDEFLLLDEDDFSRMQRLQGTAEQKLQQLLLLTAGELPTEIAEMYQYVFKRAARFGADMVNTVLTYIAISRNGLREGDLEMLLETSGGENWDPLAFAALRRYLRNHLVQKG